MQTSVRVARAPRMTWRATRLAAGAALMLSPPASMSAQQMTRTLVAVLAHPDDETPVGPVLARYAREGMQVYLIIATNGAQGAGSGPRPDSIPRGEELARTRAEEARCAAEALGVHPPILLDFPDAKLGDYAADRMLLYRVSARIAEELQRLRPDALITWGPEGGVGHPDHRLVGDIVAQLVRAGAPGAPERVFYMYIPPEGLRAINPQRGEPPLMIPQTKYLTVHVPFAPADLEAAQRAMGCHRSQFTPEVLQRMLPLQARSWNGSVTLAPWIPGVGGTDLFR